LIPSNSALQPSVVTEATQSLPKKIIPIGSLVSDQVELTQGAKGRMILLASGIDRGVVVLTDRAYIASPAASCGCHEGVLLVEHITMAWGLAMALDYHSIETVVKDERVGRERSSYIDSTINQDLFKMFMKTVSSGLKYDNQIKNTDGYSETYNKTNNALNSEISNKKPNSDKNGLIDSMGMNNTWSFHTQCMMSCISVICVLYQQESLEIDKSADVTENNHKNNNVNKNQYNNGTDQKNNDNIESTTILNNDKANTNTNTRSKETFSSSSIASNNFKAHQMFEIIARLPANTHAITKVNSSLSKQNQTEITQKRIGFGLFLSASAANHSCRPNCTVRYNFSNCNNNCNNRDKQNDIQCSNNDIEGRKSDVSNRFSSNKGEIGSNNNDKTNINGKNDISSEIKKLDIILNTLNNIQIEVVTTVKIVNNSECFISYGPLEGNMNICKRKEILKNQYLFSCLCDACDMDLKNGNENNDHKNGSNNKHNDSNKSNKTSEEPSSSPECSSELNSKISLEDHSIYLFIEYKSNLNKLNQEFNLLMNNNDENTLMKKLRIFSNSKMEPFRKKLYIISRTYFNDMDTDICDNISTSIHDNRNVHNDNNAAKTNIKVMKYQMNEKLQKLYNEYCNLYSQVHDLSAHISSIYGDYKNASEYLIKAINMMINPNSEDSYPSDDVVVARERVKLAQIYVSLGDAHRWYVTHMYTFMCV
jgi:hypothetical protein